MTISTKASAIMLLLAVLLASINMGSALAESTASVSIGRHYTDCTMLNYIVQNDQEASSGTQGSEYPTFGHAASLNTPRSEIKLHTDPQTSLDVHAHGQIAGNLARDTTAPECDSKDAPVFKTGIKDRIIRTLCDRIDGQQWRQSSVNQNITEHTIEFYISVSTQSEDWVSPIAYNMGLGPSDSRQDVCHWQRPLRRQLYAHYR